MAKKFLYFIAFCIVIFLVGRIGYEMFKEELASIALVPSIEFTPQDPLEANAYGDPGLWYAHPGMGAKSPAGWQPSAAETGEQDEDGAADDTEVGALDEAELPNFAVFFIHPTSYLNRERWNAPANDPDAEYYAKLFVRGMASPFNQASEIWAPKYRQATMGAFLTDAPEGQQAIDAAYADVREAFAFFIDSVDEDTPIVLAGHSQGSLHLLRLLQEEIKGSDIAPRIVAAYSIGWPISVEHDLPELGLPACERANQSGCLISWSSFAEPADPSFVIDTYSESLGLNGNKRGESGILCTNPLTGEVDGAAPASANLGTLVPDDSITTGELVQASVPARCDERGLLLIGDPPELGSYVLPGNNYHVYDIPLFWANTKVDVARRMRAFAAVQGDDS
ncbi:MAG: DUF3089 domain-containing protein [Erythrobacter sp.]